MKILIVTDAWLPQVNGVVRHTGDQPRAGKMGHEVVMITPQLFRTVACRPIRKFGCRCFRSNAWRRSFRPSKPTQCILPPKAARFGCACVCDQA